MTAKLACERCAGTDLGNNCPKCRGTLRWLPPGINSLEQYIRVLDYELAASERRERTVREKLIKHIQCRGRKALMRRVRELEAEVASYARAERY